MFLFVTVLALAPAPGPAPKFEYLYNSVWLEHCPGGANYVINFYKDGTFTATCLEPELEDDYAGDWRFDGKTFLLRFHPPHLFGTQTFVFSKTEKDLMVGTYVGNDVRFIKLGQLDKDELEKRAKEKRQR